MLSSLLAHLSLSRSQNGSRLLRNQPILLSWQQTRDVTVQCKGCRHAECQGHSGELLSLHCVVGIRVCVCVCMYVRVCVCVCLRIHIGPMRK